MIEIAPSVLAADPCFVHRDVQRLMTSGADLLHLDIMDGHFVPNLSFGPAMVASLKKHFPKAYLDVHLMLSDPDRYMKDFVSAGADEITVHAEIRHDVAALLQKIKAQGAKAGISIKPKTSVQAIAHLLPLCDLVLLMTVEPGFGGQKMMTEALPKLQEMRSLGFAGTLSVDGGVNAYNWQQVKQAGASRLVMGTAAFQAEDPQALFSAIHQG